MSKAIRDLWIITETGTVLFEKVFEEKIETNIFGSVMSALNTYAQMITEEGISGFEINKIKYTLIKKNEIFFLASSLKPSKNKRAIKDLREIVDKFFNKYPLDFVQKWNFDANKFSNFAENIKDLID